MQLIELKMEIPEALVVDFASDPLAPCDKVLKKSVDPTWPLFSELSRFLLSLPPEAVEAAYADRTFVGLYGRDERLARIWIAERLLIEEAARRRLKSLSEHLSPETAMPYSAGCLRDVKVDGECMVRLADFEYNDSTLAARGFSFTVCSTNSSPNSTFWLLRAFYAQGVENNVRVRLDPFLWGASNSFPQMMYKMLVYAKPLDWDGIGRLRDQNHGQMRPDKPGGQWERAEYCWDPRSDGIHFTCEELPPMERAEFEGARYLHAIYDPGSGSITHFDGALRIYTLEQLEERRKGHVRNSGKSGLRRKIFRIDQPVDRTAFSLIAQAFFIWNDDLATYFRNTLSRGSLGNSMT